MVDDETWCYLTIKIDWFFCSENSSGVSFLQVQLEHSKNDILLRKREREMCIPIVFLNVHVFGYCILNQNKNKKASLANNTAHVSYCTGKFVSVQHFYNNSISKNEQQIRIPCQFLSLFYLLIFRCCWWWWKVCIFM